MTKRTSRSFLRRLEAEAMDLGSSAALALELLVAGEDGILQTFPKGEIEPVFGIAVTENRAYSPSCMRP